MFQGLVENNLSLNFYLILCVSILLSVFNYCGPDKYNINLTVIEKYAMHREYTKQAQYNLCYGTF